jgi:hypothetical protein
VRARPAEIGQDAVAQELGNVPLEPADDLGAGSVIGAHDLAQVLRIQARRQLGRADQVAKQNGELAAFGLGRPRRRDRLCARGGAVPSLSAAIASSSRRRCPIELMPSAIRSSAVSRDSTSASIWLARKASA